MAARVPPTPLLLAVLAMLVGCGGAAPTAAPPLTAGTATPAATASAAALAPASTAGRLVDPALGLLAPPVEVPLRFVVPSVGIDAPVVAVGRSPAGAMDAPEGPASSPAWQQAFWYRRGSDPGQPGTATIAGHVDDVLGRPAAFWNIRQLAVGAAVEIRDLRDGSALLYRITNVGVYSIAQANSPEVLRRLYGDAAYRGDATLRDTAADGVSRLSLITCTGTFHRGSSFGYDHRVIAFGELVLSVPSPLRALGPL